ncbi:hypothetical protein HPX80_002183 [Salmonella enterica]|nr:hypothetical protein [Salmonella enterica]
MAGSRKLNDTEIPASPDEPPVQQVQTEPALVVMSNGDITADVHPDEAERWQKHGWFIRR